MGRRSDLGPKTALKTSTSKFRYLRRRGYCSPAVFSLRHRSAVSPATAWIALINRVLPRDDLVREPDSEARARQRVPELRFAELRQWLNKHFALATKGREFSAQTTGLGADPDGLRQINPSGRISLSSSGKSPSGALPSCPRGRGVGHRHRTLGWDAMDAAASCARWDRRAG